MRGQKPGSDRKRRFDAFSRHQRPGSTPHTDSAALTGAEHRFRGHDRCFSSTVVPNEGPVDAKPFGTFHSPDKRGEQGAARMPTRLMKAQGARQRTGDPAPLEVSLGRGAMNFRSGCPQAPRRTRVRIILLVNHHRGRQGARIGRRRLMASFDGDSARRHGGDHLCKRAPRMAAEQQAAVVTGGHRKRRRARVHVSGAVAQTIRSKPPPAQRFNDIARLTYDPHSERRSMRKCQRRATPPDGDRGAQDAGIRPWTSNRTMWNTPARSESGPQGGGESSQSFVAPHGTARNSRGCARPTPALVSSKRQRFLVLLTGNRNDAASPQYLAGQWRGPSSRLRRRANILRSRLTLSSSRGQLQSASARTPSPGPISNVPAAKRAHSIARILASMAKPTASVTQPWSTTQPQSKMKQGFTEMQSRCSRRGRPFLVTWGRRHTSTPSIHHYGKGPASNAHTLRKTVEMGRKCPISQLNPSRGERSCATQESISTLDVPRREG